MLNHYATCPICGAAYEVSAHYNGDQSICGACRAEQYRRANAPTDAEKAEQARRRERHFGGVR